MALLRLFQSLSPEEYEVDFLITDQMKLRDARSLLDEVPPWIRVLHAAKREGKLAVIKKVWFKSVRRLTGYQMFRRNACRFVKGRTYDAAFSYGEWMPPAFVARKVHADQKMLWIHTDIDKARCINGDSLFRYDHAYNRYIFVSEHSRRCAERRFPVCKGKSVVVHNMCGDASVRTLAEETCSGLERCQRPWLLSVGNFREEKNYPRQVEIMRILKERGVNLTWLCIGSRANVMIERQVRMQIHRYGLEKNFLLLGVRDNPYPYMKQADAVMSLSDYESWSLVITEAKLLGIPVIATPTSGAAEQIIDGKTGVIVPFEAAAAAERIRQFLDCPKEQQRIRQNLQGFSTKETVLEEFGALFSKRSGRKRRTKKLLFLFDDINYPSGARRAAFWQIRQLRAYYRIHIFSLCRPCRQEGMHAENDLDMIQGIPVLGSSIWEKSGLAVRPFREVMRSRNIPVGSKLNRVRYAALMRIGKGDAYMEHILGRRMLREWERYDAVVVVSEASRLRGAVSRLKHPKKIQWMHTDYASWSGFSEWTRAVTAYDARLYEKYDWIVNLSEHSRAGFVNKHPHLKKRAVVIPNFVDGKTVLQKAADGTDIFTHTEKNADKAADRAMDGTHGGEACLRLITVGRASAEKGYDRILDICGKMQAEGCRFVWYLVGDGPLLPHLKKRVRAEGLAGCVRLTGWLENPYPLMKRCDWLVLLSEYEGTPVTIDEAMVLGLSVAAADVGGIREQIGRGGNEQRGYAAAECEIADRICAMIRNRERKTIRDAFDYEKWNKDVRHRLLELFSQNTEDKL